jgi:RNA polymerase sigma-70 factor (ECF subfamily)
VEAFANLGPKDFKHLTAVARRYLPNQAEAEDAVQDALLSALKHFHQFEGRSRFSTWLHHIVVNAALKRLRRRVSERLSDEEQYRCSRPTQEELLLRAESLALLRAAIGKLRSRERETVCLLISDEDGRTLQDVAKQLGVPVGTVKARLSRSRKHLAQHYRQIASGAVSA